VTIAATNDYNIRFDHARFQATEEDLNFKDTTLETRGQCTISFFGAEFVVNGDGKVWFHGATFRTGGDGSVRFNRTTFQSDDSVVFWDASFKTDGNGDVTFWGATFKANSDGEVGFREATFKTGGNGDVVFREATFQSDGNGLVRFDRVTFRTDGSGDIWFHRATFRIQGDGNIRFGKTALADAHFRNVDFSEADFRVTNLTGADLREATIADVSVAGSTTCRRLYEGEGWEARAEPGFNSKDWDATARAYHNLKTVFSEHGLVGKARTMYVRERRARSYEAKAAYGQWDHRYLGSLPSRIFTGYGVQIRYLVFWMVILFTISTAMYVYAGVKDTFVGNVSYSVLAFTVAPPMVPEGLVLQAVMMVETLCGTLSIGLLGYVLGNRERF
jgi:uncharacterized protein YjbI with pentapeptide repeats